MTLRFFTGFDEFNPVITTFPNSTAMRLSCNGTPDSGHTEISFTGGIYGYGGAWHLKDGRGASTFPTGVDLACPVFNLGSAFDVSHHVIFGFHYNPFAFSGICAFVSSGGDQVMGVSASALGYLQALGAKANGDSGTVEILQTFSDTPLIQQVPVYLTVEMWSGSGGNDAGIIVHVDGVETLNWSGNLTDPGHSLDWAWTDLVVGTAKLPATSLWSTGQCYLDNFYLIEVDSTEPFAALGKIVRVGTLGATSEVAGQTVNYARTGGTGVTDSVGLASMDGDTSYYSSATIGDVVIFDSTDTIPGNPTQIFAIAVESYSRTTGAAGRGLTPIVRDSGGNYLGNESSLPTAYGDVSSIWLGTPSSGAELTKTNVEALAFGVKITA